MRPSFRTLIGVALALLLPAAAAVASPAPAPAAAKPAAAPAPASMPHPLHPLAVVTFAGSDNLPLWVAEREGYFVHQGLTVRLTDAPNAAYQMSNLIAGTYDIAMTPFDNVVAYDVGQGAWPVPANPDVVAVLGANDGFLSLVAQPAYPTIASLRGKTLSVAAANTGFAFVLEAVLARHGIAPDQVKLVPKGGMPARYLDLLKDKNDAATLLATPFDLMGAAHGMHVLARVGDALGPYQGEVAAVRRAFAVTHRDALIGFIRAYQQAIDWLQVPANRAVAAAILVAHVRTMTPPLAQQTLAIMLAPKGGFYRKVAPDLAGVKRVLALRTQYGVPHKVLDNPMQYLDLSYLNAAQH